jgi:hypothetical protein
VSFIIIDGHAVGRIVAVAGIGPDPLSISCFKVIHGDIAAQDRHPQIGFCPAIIPISIILVGDIPCKAGCIFRFIKAI